MHEARTEELKHDSIPELLRQLASESTTLVRQEIDLAKIEIGDKVKAAAGGAVYLGAAAIFALGAFAAVTTFLISALALGVPLWAAALIVTLVYAVVAYVVARVGKAKLVPVTPVVPQQTTQTIKEDVEWIKTRAQSGRK